MKNNIIKRLLFVIVFLPSIILYGCDDDKSSSGSNKLYISIYDLPSTSADYMAVVGKINYKGSNADIVSNIDIKFPCRALKEISSDVSFSLVLDNSLVDKYNAQHGESYQIVPDGVLEITNPNLHIKKGESISYDSVSVKLADISLLEGGKSYLAPLVISSIKGGGNCSVSSNRGFIYVFINTSFINCEGASKADMTGTLASSREGWVATLDSEPSFSGNPNVIFNESADAITMWEYDKFILTVDMSEESTVTGFCINVNNGGFFRWQSARVYISNDETKFLDQGIVSMQAPEDNWQYIKFYEPVKTRFIKLECLSTYYPYICIQEFNTYVK